MKKLLSGLILFCCFLPGRQAVAQNCSEPNSLLSITRQNVTGYTKIIFTFKKPLASDFTASAVTTTLSTYTGEDGVAHSISGCKFKKIKFDHVVWTCTTPNLVAKDSRIKAVKCTEQFEGIITYVVGYCRSTYHHRSIVNTSTRRQIILWFHN